MTIRGDTKEVRNTREAGTYFVLTSILALVFLALCALIFGSAVLASSRVRLKNLSNIAALTALNGYLAEVDPDPVKKTQTAVSRVEAILAKNSIPSARRGVLDTVTSYPDTSGSSGYLRFGLWYPVQPTCLGCGDPCDGEYPCFRDVEEGGAVNSVKAFLRTGSDNPIVAPTQMIAGTEYFIEENSTASLVPRCVEFVLDVSSSTVEQTHGFTSDPVGYPAFRVAAVNSSDDWIDNQNDQATVETFQGCAPKEDVGDQLAWCDTVAETVTKLDRADVPSPGPNDHFQDDFWFFRTPIDGESGPNRFLVDAYSFSHSNPPEPLTTFLRAFNAGSQEVAEQSSSGDSLGVMAFAKSITSDTGMSSAIDLVRQLTNVRNAFPVGAGANPNNVAWDPQGVVHPNFIDWNWIPVQGATASNLIGAMQEAYNRLIDPGTCPAFAKKIIILATDGLVNCVDTAKLPDANCASDGDENIWSCGGSPLDEDTLTGTPDSPCYPCSGVNGFNSPRFYCYPSFTSYAVAESQIMEQDDVAIRVVTDSGGGSLSVSAGTPEPGILKRLSDAGIAVTVLMSGAQTGPNFLNVGGADGKYVNPEDAGPLGWDGLPYGTGAFSPFVKWTSAPGLDATISQANGYDDDAFNSASPATPFFRPNGLLAELAFRTGGIFCPLLPQGDGGRYAAPDASGVEYMTESERANDTSSYGMQQTSITNRSITEQARDCVSKALGANPYALQEEWRPPS